MNILRRYTQRIALIVFTSNKNAICEARSNLYNSNIREYAFLVDKDIDLKMGDVVVVEVRDSIQLATFTRYSNKKEHRRIAFKRILEKTKLNALNEDFKYEY